MIKRTSFEMLHLVCWFLEGVVCGEQTLEQATRVSITQGVIMKGQY